MDWATWWSSLPVSKSPSRWWLSKPWRVGCRSSRFEGEGWRNTLWTARTRWSWTPKCRPRTSPIPSNTRRRTRLASPGWLHALEARLSGGSLGIAWWPTPRGFTTIFWRSNEDLHIQRHELPPSRRAGDLLLGNGAGAGPARP